MGKKAVIICGIICIIIIALFVPPAIKYLKIENLVKDLHSKDLEVQKKSIENLTKYGVEVVPRLLEELKTLPKLGEDDQPWYLNNGWEDYKFFGGYEFGLIKTLLSIGEPSIPILIRRLSKEDFRMECLATCTLVVFYTKSANIVLNDAISFGNSYIQHRDQETGCLHLITVKKNKTEISLIGEIKDHDDQGVYFVEKEEPSIIPILKNLVKPELRSSEVGSYYSSRPVGVHKNERILPSKLVVEEAREAIKRLK